MIKDRICSVCKERKTHYNKDVCLECFIDSIKDRNREPKKEELRKRTRKQYSREEHNLQVSCVEWFDYQYGNKGLLLFAIPNGGSRNIIEAKNLKKEGVKAGVADLCLLFPNNTYHGLFVEMKRKKGKQTVAQVEFQAYCDKMGYDYVVCRSFSSFKKIIKGYLDNGLEIKPKE